MHVEHVVITRFCLRDYFAKLPRASLARHSDPWKSRSVEQRLRFLKLISGRSLVRQSSRNFAWVIVTEADLPASLGKEILEQFRNMNRVYIHHYTGSTMFEYTDWLKDYFEKEPDYLLTTSMDDDDMISTNYIQKLQSRVNEQYRSGRLPPIEIFACSDILEWTIIPDARNPFGTVRKHDRKWKYPTTGLSLLVKHPEISWTSSSVNHAHVESYTDPRRRPETENVEKFHQYILCRLRDTGLPAGGDFGPVALEDLANKECKVVMTNHLDNLRYVSIFEREQGQKTVSNTQSFKEFSLDWNLISEEIGHFKPDRKTVMVELILRLRRKCKAFIRRIRTGKGNGGVNISI